MSDHDGNIMRDLAERLKQADAAAEALRAERDTIERVADEHITALEQDRDTLRAENEKLREALKWTEDYYWRSIVTEGCPCDGDSKCPLHAALAAAVSVPTDGAKG